MKKTHSFDELSNRVCMEPGCDKRLKQRLVDVQAPRNSGYCFEHEPKHRISGHSKRSR
jgi:hypothetical protein